MSERAKKAKPAARSRRSTNAVPPRQPLVPPLAISPRAIVLGLTGVLVAAALLAARQPLPRFDESTNEISAADPAADTPREAAIPASRASLVPVPELRSAAPVKSTTPSAPPTAPTKVAISSAPSATVPASTSTSARSVTAPRQTMTTEVRTDARTEPKATPKVESTPVTRPETNPETKPAANDQDVTLTTVTGCLVADGEGFRLKDASGSDVPKSRSWKSGFLRKKTVGIAVVDPARTLHLTTYVGQRVATTGTLVDREMRARSLTRIASGCD